MDEYDVGLLNDWGGGNVAWWHDYLRYEIARANSHWVQQTESLRAELAECKRDAERYRWIRGNVPSHSTRWSRWKVEYFYGASGWNDLRHAKLDAEIDAALAEKGVICAE